MAYDSLRFEVKEGVGLILLNRPDDGNAITLEMARELLEVAGLCDEDPEVRAVVLTGTGPMFCAGGDLKVFAARGDRVSLYMKEVTQAFHAAISRFNWMDPPVVSAINGTAAGGGLSLALTTDLALAAASAKFTLAYTKAGLVPDGGSTYFLARLVGLRRAKELVLLNPVLTRPKPWSGDSSIRWWPMIRCCPVPWPWPGSWPPDPPGLSVKPSVLFSQGRRRAWNPRWRGNPAPSRPWPAAPTGGKGWLLSLPSGFRSLPGARTFPNPLAGR